MIKKIADNKMLASIICLICAIFTYGGAVNMGWSGFAFAVPFMILWFFIALQSSKNFKTISALIFVVILGFYGLRKTDNAIFYPANGMTITLNKDVCLNISNDYALISELKDSQDCVNTNKSVSDINRSQVVPAGTNFTVNYTEISHADMGETATLHTNYENVDVHIYSPEFFFNKRDGTPLTNSDIRRPCFFYPSLLMMWPAFPILIFTTFSMVKS